MQRRQKTAKPRTTEGAGSVAGDTPTWGGIETLGERSRAEASFGGDRTTLCCDIVSSSDWGGNEVG